MNGSFADALRSRLQAIDAIGEDQTTWQRISSARQRALADQNAQLDWQRQQLDIARQRQQNLDSMHLTPTGGGGGGFNSFVNSIGKHESGGNYGAVNKTSGALGKYQIMPSNIAGVGRGWDYEALGKDISTSQFLASPQLQEKIAQYKLQQYYSKYGPAGASIAWYAGPGAANNYMKTGQAGTNMQSGGYPSIQSYMNNILGGM